MRSRHLAIILALSAAVMCTSSMAQSSRDVRLEVVYQRGAPVTAAQQWLEALRRAGFRSVRLSSGKDGVKPSVEKGEGRAIVVGVIGRDNRLALPQASFGLPDAGRIPAHLDRLMQPEQPPGKGSDGYAKLRQQFALPVKWSTSNQPFAAVFAHLVHAIPLPVDIAPSARDAVRREGKVTSELQGVSTGTALAYLLDQRDALLVPKGDPVGRLRIESRVDGDRNAGWPVGYADNQPAARRFPKLLDFLPVQVQQTPLPTLLGALQNRLELPMLLDRRSIEQRNIELEKVLVTLPEENSYYKKVLDQALFQARLTFDLRQDDAGHPFLWIRPIGE